MTTLPAATVRRIVLAVLRVERREAAVSVTFLGRVRMRALNRDHLGHDRPTDVISFALPAPDGGLVGDVYICGAVAQAQARRYGVPVRQELVRLVVHGLLHVLGHDHPEGEARVRSAMWKAQERYVRRLA
ncbi:MAG TPA: rRNA maturation RNase YbeY [Gemmatimonadales bacterium]|nr:rRNA maturation RNase YbeY [Gemmatimonadales bacterium]